MCTIIIKDIKFIVYTGCSSHICVKLTFTVNVK